MQSLKQKINDLLPIALKNNVSIRDYWDLTLLEIVQLIQANQEKQKESLKIQAQLDYQQAQLIACFVSGMFKKNATYPTLFECYGTLFEEEQKEAERLEQERQIEQWKMFIKNHNKKQRGEQ